ncbi:MAG: SPOR domain-containing protein [Candidatus Kapaibacteriota bacterium]
MSNQQQPQDEFGGFGESDNQTFKQGKAQQSAFNDHSEQSSQSDVKSGAGFISYVQPDAPAEDESKSSRKIALIAVLTLSVLALLWFILPSGKKQSNEEISQVSDTIAEVREATEKDRLIIDETRAQDSLARVQDYLARMQLAQGKNIGNNERNNEIMNDEIEEDKGEQKKEEVPVMEKAPVKKVAPPDPVPAKSYPEYNDNPQAQQAPSVQKDQPKPAPKVAEQPKPKPAPKVQLPPKVAVVKKDQVRPKQNVQIPKPKSKEQQQVIKETFIEEKPKEKNNVLKKAQAKSTGAEYSVQVMASISKDEANAALRRLQSKGVSFATLSKRSLKGKTWYRVRFGGFSERDQAESAARKAGYSNAWVERVK